MKCLAKELDCFFEGFLERVDPATAGVILRSIALREASDASQQAIGEGDRAPDFTLRDQHGQEVTLSAALAAGPVVLNFYRGGWCPFCSITLRALNRALPELRRAHATVLAVSPETPANAAQTAERNGLGFSVLSDPDNVVARRYGLVWTLEPEMKALYERLGHNIPRINGTTRWELPLGAGYVIAPDGLVTLSKVDPRIHRRLEPADALAAVRALQAQPAK